MTLEPTARDVDSAGGRVRWPESQRALEAGIDFTRANVARMYDYFLGGSHHFAVDGEQADQVIASYPDAVPAARANRAFLGRSVAWCVDQGIDQFLDLGSGVPTVGNVHEIAHRVDPGARIAYVDFEPVAVAVAEEIVADLATVTVDITQWPDPGAGEPVGIHSAVARIP